MNAMFGVLRLPIPAQPDFSMPIPDAWHEKARSWLSRWDRKGKPLMIYRPIVLRKEWNGESRNPDTRAYADLYNEIRQHFFVVSIAHLESEVEWIVGPEADVDVKLHYGELDFETMAVLFKQADLVFSGAGFAPVLAQSVGTPVVIVYGGRESYKTTDVAGQHLAPTLGIDPIHPCDCHHHGHDCDKRIDVPAAREKLRKFIMPIVKSLKVLVFGTTYVDSEDRVKLTQHWIDVHGKLNADCDLLLVDSASPMPFPPCDRVEVIRFANNIGHLSRKGRDGWGRAFCRGLQEAINRGYDYVVHIEGDSLFRLPVMTIVRNMEERNQNVLSTPVRGMKRDHKDWLETGLMFFSVDYLKRSNLIDQYDYPNRTESPTPEVVLWRLIGDSLTMMPWRALRGDKNQITSDNVTSLGLDWVTHCHNDVAVYDKFATMVLDDKKEMLPKINLGCGRNRLEGWMNVDREVDISKPLPFAAGSAQFMLAEHVVEHIPYYDAIEFFKDCRRVLCPGGVLRVSVPSIESIFRHASREYCKFTTKWQPDATLRGALFNILYCHGHKAAWTDSLLEVTLYYAGFSKIVKCDPHHSMHKELQNVDGHWKEIGEQFNAIESIVYEAS